MRRVPFDVANGWSQHPELCMEAGWKTATGEENVVFEAAVSGQTWQVRINDFPVEPCYTLLIDGNEVMHFDDWPYFWQRPVFPNDHSQSVHDAQHSNPPDLRQAALACVR